MRSNMNIIRRYFYRKHRDRTEMADENDTDDSIDKLTVDPDSSKPHRAWRKLKSQCKVEKLKPMSPSTPISEDSIRFVCVGDTHVRLEKKGGDVHDVIPPGDVLLHVGDFSMYGGMEEITLFNDKFGTLPHKVKILIAGNHDMTLDPMTGSKEEAEKHRNLLTNFIYLEDALLELCGIKIYGSPWVPVCGSWGFTLHRGVSLLRRWNKIPNDVDILMTHGPPLGYGDTVFDGHKVGCVDLLNTIRHRVQPKYHVCGHIHEGYGMRTDGQTVFINSALCTKLYRPTNPPIVFDYPLPPGHTKQEMDDVLSSLQKHFLGREKDTAEEERDKVHKAENFMEYCSEQQAEVNEEEDNDDIVYSDSVLK